MKRSEQQEIDTQANRIFCSKLSKVWVERAQHQNDFGIDYEIEYFKNQLSTGIIFKIQLKGCKQANILKTKKKQPSYPAAFVIWS